MDPAKLAEWRFFCSTRFDDTQKEEAVVLKKALAKHGIDVFLSAPELIGGGQSIDTVVFENMEACDGFIALGTKNYAENTGNAAR